MKITSMSIQARLKNYSTNKELIQQSYQNHTSQITNDLHEILTEQVFEHTEHILPFLQKKQTFMSPEEKKEYEKTNYHAPHDGILHLQEFLVQTLSQTPNPTPTNKVVIFNQLLATSCKATILRSHAATYNQPLSRYESLKKAGLVRNNAMIGHPWGLSNVMNSTLPKEKQHYEKQGRATIENLQNSLKQGYYPSVLYSAGPTYIGNYRKNTIAKQKGGTTPHRATVLYVDDISNQILLYNPTGGGAADEQWVTKHSHPDQNTEIPELRQGPRLQYMSLDEFKQRRGFENQYGKGALSILVKTFTPPYIAILKK